MEAAGTELGRINPGAVSSSAGKTALMLGESCQLPYPMGEAKHLDSAVVISWLWCLRGGNGLCVHTHFPPVLGKGKTWNFGL